MFSTMFQTKAPQTQCIEETLAGQLWEIKQKIKELKEQEDQLVTALKLSANNQTQIWGAFIFMLKSRKGSIAYAEIPELQDVDLEQYRGPEVRYFELNKR